MKTKNKFIFIVGPPRSGTTFTLMMTWEHPRVSNYFGDPYESNIFGDFTDRERIAKALRGVQEDYIVYKSPKDCERIDKILKAFPDSLLVYTLRNPFDVLESYLNAPFGGLYHLEDVYNQYKKSIELVTELKDKILILDYEKIIRKPQDALEKIFDYADLEYDREMIKTIVDKHKNGEGMVKEKRELVYKLEKKDKLTPGQVKRIQIELFPGYENLLKSIQHG